LTKICDSEADGITRRTVGAERQQRERQHASLPGVLRGGWKTYPSLYIGDVADDPAKVEVVFAALTDLLALA
jgi:hypothetical protein